MKVLIANDDGIESFFLRVLVEAFLEKHEVFVAAPRYEQSWIGRAISRYKTVRVEEYNGFNCSAYAVEGTPVDCVNIALGHLFEGRPDVVVSGINIGHNTYRPMILSSGTFGAATEGIAWRIPSIAFSQVVQRSTFDDLKASDKVVEASVEKSVKKAAQVARNITEESIEQLSNPYILQNINFPINTELDTPIEDTVPENLCVGSFFKKEADGSFNFEYPVVPGDYEEESDLACLKRGNISCTYFDFTQFGSLRSVYA